MRKLNLYGLVLFALLLSALPFSEPHAQNNQAARPAPAVSIPSSIRKAAEGIRADRMKEDLYFVSSDEMAGRDTPSAGLDATAKFLADRLARAKVKPAGDDGSYFQKIELTKREVDRERTRAELSGRPFRVGDDFLPAGRGNGEAEGQLVYAGHGWVIKSKGINAYEGLDVKDKFVVVANNGMTPPAGITMKELGELPAGDWESPASYAQKNGARGLVLVPQNFERVWRFGAGAVSRAGYRVKRFEEEGEAAARPSQNQLLAIYPSGAMLDAIFAGERSSGADVLKASVAGQPLGGFALSTDKRLRVAVEVKTSTAMTQNVVGVLEGRDPVLKNEYVALGAHYDHVGVGRPNAAGDAIYNGADDDGSGTVAVLHIAEALARGQRPKRSVLFVWHTAEEKGLWGSEYFAKYPTVPLDKIVTQINIDMIGRSKQPGDTNPANKMLTGPNEIYVIGSRMMSTELGELNEAVNNAYLKLNYNYHYDAPNDPERLFYRSDHYNYAKMGIPIVFFFDGVHEDYHQPSDHADKIDYQKMEKITRTIFILTTRLGDAPARPVVDKPLQQERFNR